MLPLVPAAVLSLALWLDASAPAEATGDPLAPALSGLVQCYDPDMSSHTCQSIAAYRRGRDGGWTDIATIMPDPTQPLTIEIESPVAVRDGSVCSTLRRDNVLSAKLRYFDRPVPADHALPILAQIADTLAGAMDREVCTTYVQVPGGLVARGRLAGTPTAYPDQRFIWVRADAGYRVAPKGPDRG